MTEEQLDLIRRLAAHALTKARSSDHRPTVVLSRTVKGKDVPELEDKNGWRGKVLPPTIAP